MNSTPSKLQDASVSAIRGLGAGARFAFRVSGTSMQPVLLAGDEIVAVRCADPSELSLGELLVVELPDVGLVVHRLLWKGAGTVRTRGDGSGVMDPPVPRDDVLGRVVEASRDGVDVLPGSVARLGAWLRHFGAASAHRLKRRLQGDESDPPSR